MLQWEFYLPIQAVSYWGTKQEMALVSVQLTVGYVRALSGLILQGVINILLITNYVQDG